MDKPYNVRIDRVTQGSDGHEMPADRLSVNSEDFLWIYVEAELPSGAVPKGEYSKLVGERPGTPVVLDPPTRVTGQYRFSVIHYVLSKQTKYLFRFADQLTAPTYKDEWEIKTLL